MTCWRQVTLTESSIDLQTLRPKGRPKGSKDGLLVPRLRSFPEAAAAVDELIVANGIGERLLLPGSLTLQNQMAQSTTTRMRRRMDSAMPTVLMKMPKRSANIVCNADSGQAHHLGIVLDDDDADDDDVVVIREHKHDEYDEQAQTDFDREFARMLADTTVERKAAPPIFDQAVPMFRKRPAGPNASASVLADRTPDVGKMQFMLLSKKGNKPQVSSSGRFG